MENSQERRVILWDIDGTLVRSARTGAFKDYTAPVLESVFGTAGRLAELSVSGMTDLQIVAEALRDEGFTHQHIRERVGELRTRYMVEMERATAPGVEPLFQILPGAREMLEALAAHPRYLSALLTGNIEPAAYLKMRLVGLAEFFRTARRVRRRLARPPRPSRARRRAHQPPPRSRTSPRAVYRHRRHAQRHRLRTTLWRACRRRRHRAQFPCRRPPSAQPRRHSFRPHRYGSGVAGF